MHYVKKHAACENAPHEPGLEGDGEEPHQDRLGGHEQGSVRVSEHKISMGREGIQHGPRPDLSSATSPLEGANLVISEAASSNQNGTLRLVFLTSVERTSKRGPGAESSHRASRRRRRSTRQSAMCGLLGMRAWRFLGGDRLAQETSEHMPTLQRGGRNQRFGPW